MKYPGGVKMSKVIKDISYGNRGMSLEEDLNISNSYYVDRGVAFIYKKPTPIQITKVDYPSRSSAVILRNHLELIRMGYIKDII